MRTPEEVAREVLGNIAGPMRHIFGSSPAHHELLDALDVLVSQEIGNTEQLIRARDAEVAEQVRAETLAGLDAFAVLLAATREGLARSGSKAKGVEQVREMLAEHAGAIHAANEAAHDRVQRGRPHWNRPWEPEP